MYEKEKRFQVQTVIRPKTEEYHDFRGYAGKLYGTILKLEMPTTPSLTESKVPTFTFDNNLRKLQ
jgi:sulfate adenylyltransferase subunit 1